MSSQVSHDAFRAIFPKYAELLSQGSLPGNESIETFLREELPRKVELVRNMQASFNAFLTHFTTAILKRPQHSHLIHSLILKASDKIEKYFHHLSLITHKIDQADLKERLSIIDVQHLKREFRAKLESVQGLLREKYFGGGFMERECEEEIAMRLYVLLELFHFLKADPVTVAGKFRLKEQEVLWAVSKNQQASDISGLINLDAVFLANLEETVQKRCRPFSNKRELLDSKVREVLREGESRVGPNINLLLESLISKERVRISRQLGNSLGRQLREIPQCEGESQAKQMISQVQLLKRQFAQLKNTTYFLDIMRGSFSEKYKMEVNRLQNVFYLTNLQKFLQDVSTFLEKVLSLQERLIHNRRDYMRDFGNAIEIRISDLIDSYGSKSQFQGLSEIIQNQFELLQSALYGIVSKPAVKQEYNNYQREDREGERRRQLEIKAQEERERKQGERSKLEEKRRKDEERLQKAREERQEKQRQKRQQNERLEQQKKAQLERKREQKARKDEQLRRQKQQEQHKREDQDKIKREEQNRNKQQEQQKKKRERDEEMRRRDEEKKRILEKQQQEKRKRQNELKERKRVEQQEKSKRERQRKAQEERIKREKQEREAEQRRKQEDRLRAQREKRERESKEGQERRKEEQKQKRERQQRQKQQRQAQQRKKQEQKARIEKEKKERQLRQAEEKQKRERQRKQREAEDKRRQEDKLKAQKQKKERERKLEEEKIAKQKQEKAKRDQEEKLRFQKQKKQKEDRERRDREQRQSRQREQKQRKEKQQRQKKQKLQRERKEKQEKEKEKERKQREERQKRDKEERERKQREQKEKKEKLERQKRERQERQRKEKEQREKKQKLQRQKRQKQEKERLQKEKKLKQQREAEEKMRREEQQRLKKEQQLKNKAVKKPQPKKSSGINYGSFDEDNEDNKDNPIQNMQQAGNNKASKIQKEEEQEQYAEDFDDQSPQKPGEIQTKELIGPNDIKCLNDYMKGTTYARKNKPNAELLNKESLYLMLFEELVQNKKIFIFSGPISKAMLDLGEELANPDTSQDDLRMSVETIKEEMFRVYEQIFAGEEMQLNTRFVFPFPFKNQFNLKLIQLVPAHCYFQIVFQEAMDEDEQIQNRFRGAIQALLHIFQLQGEPSIEDMIVGEQSKLVLGTFDKELPSLLLLFARHYEQQNAAQVLINQYTIQRFFYTTHPIEPLYQAIKDEQINDFYEKLYEKFSAHDKVKIFNVQVTSAEQDYAHALAAESRAIKEEFVKTKHQSVLCCFTINLVNENDEIEDKVSVYLSLDRASPKIAANYFLVSKDAAQQENASLIFEYISEGDENFEVSVYTDFSRHNGLSEYSDWALPLWAHTTIKRKLSTLQAMRAISFAMTPFYLAFKEMD